MWRRSNIAMGKSWIISNKDLFCFFCFYFYVNMTKKTDKLIKRYWSLSEKLYDIASDPKTSAAELKQLSKLSDQYILTAVALNPKTPVSLLERLYEHYSGVGGTDEEMRVHIVNNPALTTKLLKKYAKGDASEVVQHAAAVALGRKSKHKE